MKYRGRDDIIVSRAIDRATYQARTVEPEPSQLQAGQVIPIGSHWKQLTEYGGFRAPRRTRCRHVWSIKQHIDEVTDEVGDGVVAWYVVREVVEEVAGEVAGEVGGEAVGEVAEEVTRVVVDEMNVEVVQPNVVVAHPIPFVIINT